MDKKTIFLLPLDLKGKKQTRITPKFIRNIYSAPKVNPLPEHIQNKKKNIFTVELNRLINKISDKNKSQEIEDQNSDEIPAEKFLPEQAKDIPHSDINNTKIVHPNLSEEEEILDKIYANVNSIKNASLYLQRAFAKIGIEAFSFFYFEPHTFTYYPVLFNGLSERASTNLLFQANDKFIQNKKNGFIHLFFQPLLINDLFFKKKLSNSEFTQYSSLFLTFMDKYNLPGLISVFLKEGFEAEETELQKLSTKIHNLIEPLVPFLNSYFYSNIQSRIDSFDFLKKIIYEININAKSLKNSFYFTKIKITNFLTIEEASSKKRNLMITLKNHLLKEECLISISFNELIILTKENEAKKIMDYISETTNTEFKFELESRKYPEHGKNLYLYF